MHEDLPPQTELHFMASADELATILEIMEQGRFSTYTGVIHAALVKLAQQLDVTVPPGAFEFRRVKRAKTK